jgi:hypothetical protein
MRCCHTFIHSLTQLFRHFDPNDSGSVHFGEFVWAFFNRRGLVRQWKRKTDGLTHSQVIGIFHAADTNGNGRLSPKEFKKLLAKQFKLDLSDSEIEILTGRFDVDGDGDIDIDEFLIFIESEQKDFDATATSVANGQLQSSLLAVPKARTCCRSPSPALQTHHATTDTNTDINTISNTDLTTTAAPIAKSDEDESRSRAAAPHGATARVSHRVQLNATAPAALQNKSAFEATTRTTQPSHSKSVATNEKKLLLSDTSEGNNKLEDNVDVLWMSRMLQAQSDIESRLGNRYYKNQ